MQTIRGRETISIVLGAVALILCASGGFGLAVLPSFETRIIATLGLASVILLLSVLLHKGLGGLTSLFLGLAVFSASFTGLRVSESISVGDVFLVFGAAFTLPRLLSRRLSDNSAFRLLLVGVSLIFLGGMMGTLFVAANPLQSLVELLKLLTSMMLVPLIFYAWQPTRSDLDVMTRIWVLGVVTSVIVGVSEIGTTYQGRVDGLTLHPNTLGLSSVLAFGPAVALTLAQPGLRRWVYALSSMLLAGGILISGSRAALAGMLAVVLALLLFSKQWKLVRAYVVGGIAAILLLASPLVDLPEGNALARLMAAQDTTSTLRASESDAERELRAQQALTDIREHPLTGVGFENALYAHSVYLQVLSSGGVVALVGLLVAAYAVLSFLPGQLLRHDAGRDPDATVLLVGLSASFVGYLVAGVVHNALWERYIWVLPALALALLPYAQARSDSVEPEQRQTSADPVKATQRSPRIAKLPTGRG